MTEFERSLVNSFNEYFTKDENPQGIAHRKKQHRYSSQLCDVLVDSPDKDFYLAIENKSVKESLKNKLYFSSHFSEAEGTHQVERISKFIDRSGRNGVLAVEVRRGRGKKRQGYLYPWSKLREKYRDESKGLSLEEVKENGEKLEREGSNYFVGEIDLKKFR